LVATTIAMTLSAIRRDAFARCNAPRASRRPNAAILRADFAGLPAEAVVMKTGQMKAIG
jgi:hypothetical protein